MAASPLSSPSPAADTPAWPALVALLALLLMGGALAWSWRTTVGPERAGADATKTTSTADDAMPVEALSTFVQQGVQPGASAPIETGRDEPLYRSPEGTEFFRFRFNRRGEIVTAGYRVRLGPQHEFYVLQEFDCARPLVKPLAAGATIMGLRFESDPRFGPLDDSHSDARMRELFCAMQS